MTTLYEFYGLNLGIPLSEESNEAAAWGTTRAGRLHKKSEGAVYVHELSDRERQAQYAWFVVDAYYSQEDSVMSYFKAFGLGCQMLPEATFGVHWNDCPHRIVTGQMAYKPRLGNGLYVPADGFLTQETGGYTVQVLDKNYPSEGLSFGHYKYGDRHEALVVIFQLLEQGRG